MLKHKRTRVLLYVLGSFLVVAIGLAIWGAASGRISTFADVIILPPTPVFNIKGQVTNKNGEVFGRPGYVTLNRYDPTAKKYSVVGETSMDKDGYYGFSNIPANAFYRLEAYEPNCHKTLIGSSLSGKANETKTFNLAMMKYPSITGKITYKDGTPVQPDIDNLTHQVTFMAWNYKADMVVDFGSPAQIDNSGNYERSCNDPDNKVVVYAKRYPGQTEGLGNIVKIYTPAVPWAGAVLNITLPFNRSDRPL